MNYKDVTKESYNSSVEAYAARNASRTNPRLQAFFDMLPGTKVLEVGCGDGRDAKIYSEQGFVITGIDISEKMIAHAKQHAVKAEFFVMDATSLEFPDNTFDGVLAAASLHHVSREDMPKVIKEIHRVLKPGGLCRITVKKGDNARFEKDERYGGVEKFWNYMNEEYLREQLSDFEIVEMIEHPSESNPDLMWVEVVARSR